MKPNWNQQNNQFKNFQQQQQQRMQEQNRRQFQQFMQQQQQRQQQFLEQQRRGAAWMQQQKAKERQARQQAAAAPLSFDPFEQVEYEVSRLRSEWTAGSMSKAQFEEALKKLMFQDHAGTWWMVGSESGSWYQFDGSNWVPAVRPRQPAYSAPSSYTGGRALYVPRGHPFWGFIVFLLALMAAIGLGFAVGGGSYSVLPSDISSTGSLMCASATWLVGLVISFRLARRVWRGY